MIQSPAGYQGDVRIKRYLDFYQAGYGVAMLSSGVAFSPLSLFANGEQGGWYDPSDLTTLYQDAAGTTPVTAVEQPVGLVLDKSRGLVLGSELFSGLVTDGWTALAGTTISANTSYDTSGTTGPIKTDIFTVGKTYLVTYNLSATNSCSVRFQNQNTGGAGIILAATAVGGSSGSFYVQATATGLFLRSTIAGASTITINSLSVRELPGNHLSQSTAAARPVLSSRVNLLTYTEQFDNAAWTKAAVTVSTDQTTAPDGTSTADLLAETATNAIHQIFPAVSMASGVAYSAAFHLKKGPGATAPDWVRLTFRSGAMSTSPWANFNINTGVVGNTSGAGISASITSLPNGWYRCAVTATADATSASGGVIFQFTNNTDTTASASLNIYTGTTTSNIYIWGADLRPANAGVGLPAYQRVGAATDYDTTGFPLYLKFDGTDDFLQSSTITPGAVDKAQVFAGVRKLSDATIQNIAEYGVNWFTNAGTLGLGTSGTTVDVKSYFFVARRSGNGARDATVYAAPITNVLSCEYDFAAATENDKIKPRINGIVPTLSNNPATTGTGNFGSYALTVGRRGSGLLLFNGHLYSLILRFSAANLDAATITATETWVNSKTLAY